MRRIRADKRLAALYCFSSLARGFSNAGLPSPRRLAYLRTLTKYGERTYAEKATLAGSDLAMAAGLGLISRP